LKSSTRDLVLGTLKPTMEDYVNPEKKHITVGWDNIQQNFKCCGLEDGLSDWQKAINGTPLTCCEIPHGVIDTFTCNDKTETLHGDGCVASFGAFIQTHAKSLGLAGIGLAVIQLIGLLFACMIARMIKKHRGYTGT
jgi:CD63 antigen